MTIHLGESKKLISHFEDRKARAAERLAKNEQKEWCFAIVGIQTDIEKFSFSQIGELRRVIEPPGEIELAAALKESHLFGAIGRYSNGITHELAINKDVANDDQAAFNIAWHIISAIRIRTLAEFLIPAVADYSWSVIAALEKQQCNAKLIEDVPQAMRIENPINISEIDLQWVLNKISVYIELAKTSKFQIALEALTTHQHLLSFRMMVASLWSGIDALIGIQMELRFRSALSIACILEPRGLDRSECYRRIKKLYDIRSQAVHGAEMSNEKLVSHISEARKLLSRIICSVIEDGKLFSEEDIEKKLLE
jgi:hypothetical protein